MFNQSKSKIKYKECENIAKIVCGYYFHVTTEDLEYNI